MIDHLARGLSLGYPECCVRQFAAEHPNDQARKRGTVALERRANGDEFRYVPCDAHAGPHTPGWQPW